MRETSIHPSLLSYILPEHSNFCLRLLAGKSYNSSIAVSPPPFRLLNDNDPLAHTFRGAFVTDFGSTIKEVNLLIQRDTIEWPSDQENVLTNSIVDQYWQQAMTTRLIRAPDNSMLLAAQIGEQQQLLAFTSLFYCREKEAFFEPPCPDCGQTLELCKDDDLLHASGLPPYTKSLRRFLFCPSCFQTENHQILYTLDREADDPSTVYDCRQLILDFNKLTPSIGKNTALPCLTCQQHKFCYGDQQAVYDAIFTLSFYPFYMLITECDSLDGFHLLTLLQKDLPPPITFPMNINQGKKKEEDQDKAIHTIIQEISQKWQQGQVIPEKDTTEEQQTLPLGDESLTATLPMGNNHTNEDLSQETIIIKSPANHLPENRESLQTETVLLSGNPTINKHTHPLPQTSQLTEKKTLTEEDELAETVILKPGKKV